MEFRVAGDELGRAERRVGVANVCQHECTGQPRYSPSLREAMMSNPFLLYLKLRDAQA